MSDTQPAGTPVGFSACKDPHCLCRARTAGPSTPPAQRHAQPRGAAGGHPGTLDGPGVLGRALVDRDGCLWQWRAGDMWGRGGSSFGVCSRAELEARHGPVREVLLVDPAAGRVLDAARELRDADRAIGRQRLDLDADRPLARAQRLMAAECAVVAAVDAYDRPTTGGPDREDDADPHPPVGDQLCDDPDCGCCYPGGMEEAQPAGDGSGWQRQRIEELISGIPYGHHTTDPVQWEPADPAQLRALLADRGPAGTGRSQPVRRRRAAVPSAGEGLRRPAPDRHGAQRPLRAAARGAERAGRRPRRAGGCTRAAGVRRMAGRPVSRVEIDAGSRKVTVEHDGELAHLTQAARDLWDHTHGALPEKPVGAVGFTTQMRYEPPPVSQGAYSGRGRPRVTGEVTE